MRAPSRRTLVAGCFAAACSSSEPVPSAPSATTSSTAAVASAAPSAAPSVSAATKADPDAPREPEGPAFTKEGTFDVLVEGGRVFDGTGSRPIQGDVLIDEGKVVHVGVVGDVKVETRIDAKGLVVSPGFIDTHSHGDPKNDGRWALSQGVTTICVGQDGSSPGDGRASRWIKSNQRTKMGVNVAAFAGHGTIRSLAKVGLRKDPTPEQIARMAELTGEELDAGAWGLTTGLEYRPGTFATRDELVEVAKAVAKRNGVIMSHLRSEDDEDLEASVDELLAQGREGGARVHLAHVKVVYGHGAPRAEKLLGQLAAARKDGVDVTADIYPYNASYTTISIVFPDFALPPNKWRKVKRERRDELATFLRERVTKRGGPEATLFGSKPFAGKTLKEVADAKDKPFEDVLIDHVGPGGASAAYFVMDDALQSRLLLDAHVMIGSDGGPYSSHPRGYGSFAKVWRRDVVEREALSIAEAVRKMSGLPAATVGLDRLKRGRLAPGWAADVAVFDPAEVKDKASYERPRVYAAGMRWVLVNGRVVIDDGKFRKRKAGRLLVRPTPAADGPKTTDD